MSHLRGAFLQDRAFSSKNVKNLATRRCPVCARTSPFKWRKCLRACVAGSVRWDGEGKWRSEDFGRLSRCTRYHCMNKFNRSEGNFIQNVYVKFGNKCIFLTLVAQFCLQCLVLFVSYNVRFISSCSQLFSLLFNKYRQ